MPFDAAGFADADTDALTLFRERRERAVALWATVPEERWDMSDWRSPCGTTACALGWLAARGHDGWDWWGGRVPPHRGFLYAAGAARYFGISLLDGDDLFVNYLSTATIAEVSARLLALPYALPG